MRKTIIEIGLNLISQATNLLKKIISNTYYFLRDADAARRKDAASVMIITWLKQLSIEIALKFILQATNLYKISSQIYRSFATPTLYTQTRCSFGQPMMTQLKTCRKGEAWPMRVIITNYYRMLIKKISFLGDADAARKKHAASVTP